VIVYAAGLTSVDQCEKDEGHADLLHAEAPAAMAAAARDVAASFVYISTDHLWDGSLSMVSEQQPLRPVNAYARSKAKGEQWVGEANAGALIIRTNFFGRGRPWRHSLSDWMEQMLASGQELGAFIDAHFTPIAVPILCRMIERAVVADLTGIFHICGRERLSKYEFAIRLADWRGLPDARVRMSRLADAGLLAPRPGDMSLSTQKISAALGVDMPDIAESLTAALGPQVAFAANRG
jgi:dTDP-4-dehydrorhamnose reductase